MMSKSNSPNMKRHLQGLYRYLMMFLYILFHLIKLQARTKQQSSRPESGFASPCGPNTKGALKGAALAMRDGQALCAGPRHALRRHHTTWAWMSSGKYASIKSNVRSPKPIIHFVKLHKMLVFVSILRVRYIALQCRMPDTFVISLEHFS